MYLLKWFILEYPQENLRIRLYRNCWKKIQNNMEVKIPKTAFVVFNDGAFGGGVKRETNLFIYLSQKYPGRFYFFTNHHLYNQINEIYDNLPDEYIKIVDLKNNAASEPVESVPSLPRRYSDNIADPIIVDQQHTLLRKIYWY